MEAAAAETGETDIAVPTGNGGPELADGEPYLKPVKGKKVELDEEASPVAGRRFTRT
jgi:hypothetical protein